MTQDQHDKAFLAGFRTAREKVNKHYGTPEQYERYRAESFAALSTQATDREKVLEEVLEAIRVAASGRDPLPLPSGTKEAHRNVALTLLGLLLDIETRAREAVRHRALAQAPSEAGR